MISRLLERLRGQIDESQGSNEHLIALSAATLLLEVAWNALEDAGIVPRDLTSSRTGIYIGACATDQQVISGVAQQGIAARTALQLVVARATP